jgi:hypothetical protein
MVHALYHHLLDGVPLLAVHPPAFLFWWYHGTVHFAVYRYTVSFCVDRMVVLIGRLVGAGCTLPLHAQSNLPSTAGW